MLANEWGIGVSPWIIQDGNYPEFFEGQDVAFALEFYSENGLQPSAQKDIRAEHVSDSTYRVAAELVFKEENVWAVDFGVLAFHESKPPACAALGDLLEGEIHLGIDPFFYFEYLYKQQGIPPLTYRWHINAIFRHTAPLMNHPTRSNVLAADKSRETIDSVTKTDAWHEDRGNSLSLHYVLNTRLLGGPERPDGRNT